MKLFILFLFLFIVRLTAFAQNESPADNRTVATAGSYKITAEEFRDRYEFSPHPRTEHSLDTALVKREYLYTLIAEKLLAQKAKTLELDTAKDIVDQLTHLEKLFTRDALFKKEITNKVKITPNAVAEAERRTSEVLLVKYLYSPSRNEIGKLYLALNRGAPIDSLLQGRPEAEEQEPYAKITYGTLDSYVEDSLFNLKTGGITSPIYTGERWYIFKLYKIIHEPFFKTTDNMIKVKKTIESSEANKLENDYLFNFLHNLKVDVDRSMFAKIVSAAENILKSRKASAGNSHGSNVLYLLADDINKIEDALGIEILNKIFIKLENKPETVRQFLDELKYDNIKIDSSNISGFAFVLNKLVKDHIQSELLVRLGYRTGLENSPGVKKDMSMWESYYLSQELERKIYDSISISDEEAYEFFTKNYDVIYKPDEINLEEIIAANLDEIGKALKELNNGSNFNDVAEKYCIVDSIKQRGGELGYLPVNRLGKLGDIAEKMKTGEVYGPVKVNEGYALIKLVDIRKPDKPQDTSFVKNKNDIIDLMKRIRFENRLKAYVVNLASEYGVKINTDVLLSIPVLRMNTVTVRMIGFGGRILAFPYSPLFANWYEEYINEQKKIVQ